MADRGFNSIFVLIAILFYIQLDVALLENPSFHFFDENKDQDLAIEMDVLPGTKLVVVSIFYDSATDSGNAFFNNQLTSDLFNDLISCNGIQFVFNPCSTSKIDPKTKKLVCVQNEAQCVTDRSISCVTDSFRNEPKQLGNFVLCMFSGKNAPKCLDENNVNQRVNQKCVDSGHGDIVCDSFHNLLQQTKDTKNGIPSKPNIIYNFKSSLCTQVKNISLKCPACD